MLKQKPVSTFTLCDDDGNKYEINEFTEYTTLSSPNNSIDTKAFKRPLYKTKDGQNVVKINGVFEIVNPPNNIKLQKCG
jgi:hypothetical protein